MLRDHMASQKHSGLQGQVFAFNFEKFYFRH